MIIDKDAIKKLMLADEKARDSLQARHSIYKEIFKPGTFICWRHGKHLQRGNVICVIGSIHNLCVRVQNSKTTKTVDIAAYSVDWDAMQRQYASYVSLLAEVDGVM
jgi:hypothetical protein